MSDKQVSDNLFESLVILSNTLRDKGFKEESIELDEKIRNFKTAEVHLYNAFEETGEDLLGSAHPEGDVELCPAKEGLGVFETQPTQHKKIVDVINKTPTGKFASKKVEEIVKQTAMVLGVEKTAWGGVFPEWVTDPGKYVSQQAEQAQKVTEIGEEQQKKLQEIKTSPLVSINDIIQLKDSLQALMNKANKVITTTYAEVESADDIWAKKVYSDANDIRTKLVSILTAYSPGTEKKPGHTSVPFARISQVFGVDKSQHPSVLFKKIRNFIAVYNKELDAVAKKYKLEAGNLQKNEIEKIAIDVPEPESRPGAEGKPAGSTPVAGTTPAKGIGAKGNSDVVAMQDLLSEIGKQININPKAAIEKFPKTLGENKKDNAVAVLQSTHGEKVGVVSSEPHDGLWGPRTDAALEIANSLAIEADKSGESSTKYLITGEGRGYIGDPNISDIAKKNSETLRRLYDYIVRSTDPSAKPAGKAYKVPFEGKEVVITDKDLSSLENFYAFLATNGIAQQAISQYETLTKQPGTLKANTDKNEITKEAVGQTGLGLTYPQWFKAFDLVNGLINQKVQAGQDVSNMIELNKKLALLGQQFLAYTEDLKKQPGMTEEKLRDLRITAIPPAYSTSLSYHGEGAGGRKAMSPEQFAQMLMGNYPPGTFSDEQMGAAYTQYLRKMRGGLEGEGFGPGSVPANYPPITDKAIYFNHPLWKGTAFPTITSKLLMSQVINYQFSPDKALDLATLWADRLSRAYDGRASQALYTFLFELSKKIAEVSMQFTEQYGDQAEDRPAQLVANAAEVWQTVLKNIMNSLRKGQAETKFEQKYQTRI